MKRVLVILVFQIGITSALIACGCGGPINSLKTDIYSSDAIFIGIITEINKNHAFHLNDGVGKGLKFINFNVVKSHRGLSLGQLKITLFDSKSNSSCEGIFYGKEIGDTVLVFAEEFSPRMLGSYLCGRHPTFGSLSIEELNFINTANWIDPRLGYNNAKEYIRRTFPNINEQDKMGNKSSGQGIWNLIAYLSIGINLILVFLILRKE